MRMEQVRIGDLNFKPFNCHLSEMKLLLISSRKSHYAVYNIVHLLFKAHHKKLPKTQVQPMDSRQYTVVSSNIRFKWMFLDLGVHQTRVVSSKMAIFASFSYYTFKHSHTRPKLLNCITVQISHWLSTDTEIDVVIKSNQIKLYYEM